eukprot:3662964-Rhodomonas_salina.1
MARQTVRHPPAQHTGLTEWPGKLSVASSTAHWPDGMARQTQCQMHFRTAHGPDVMARQTIRCPPAQHTGRTEWPGKLSDTIAVEPLRSTHG